jgi:hypothetical protein
VPKVLNPIFNFRFFVKFLNSKLNKLCWFNIFFVSLKSYTHKLIQRINNVSHFRCYIINIVMLKSINEWFNLILSLLNFQSPQKITLEWNNIALQCFILIKELIQLLSSFRCIKQSLHDLLHWNGILVGEEHIVVGD